MCKDALIRTAVLNKVRAGKELSVAEKVVFESAKLAFVKRRMNLPGINIL